MATNCTNCGCSKISCGCENSFLITPPPCPTPEGCPDRQPCSEVFDAQCVVYTGPNLQCGLDNVVLTNTSLNLALEDIIGYFCTSPASDITVVAAGNGIDVDANTVGDTTTYTVTATNKLKFVKEITTNFDSASIGISQDELNACALSPTICSATPVEFSDFTLSLWWLDGTTWKLLQPYESVTQSWAAIVNDTTGAISITITRPITVSTHKVRAVLVF
jgi:hypothetical protein